jgi:hypothetical protein
MTLKGGLVRDVPGYRRDLPEVNIKVKCSGEFECELDDEEVWLVTILTLLNNSTRTRRSGRNVSVGFG